MSGKEFPIEKWEKDCLNGLQHKIATWCYFQFGRNMVIKAVPKFPKIGRVVPEYKDEFTGADLPKL